MTHIRTKNPHLGETLDDYINERKNSSSQFALSHQTAFDSLQLARKIKSLRDERSISQEQLAQMVGTKQPSIARLEKGKTIPKLELLQRIAMALGMRLELNFIVDSPSERA